MKQLVSAGIIVYRTHNNTREYLLLFYPHGHWDLAKGKIEAGETKKQTALRELKEETGLTATIHDGFEESFTYIFTDHNGQKTQKTVYFFVGQASANAAVILSHEHIGYAWLAYEQALEQLTFQNARQLLHKAHLFLQSNAE